MEVMKGYQGESRLLRKESFREMMSPEESKPGVGRYNIFWELRPNGNIGHTGADPGATALMFFHPASNVGAIVFTNASLGNDKDPAQRQFQDVVNALLTSVPAN
jgi:hypothetical protein